MLGGGGCWACFRSGPISVGGGVGAAKGLLPYFLVPKGNQPTACTLALWWLKFGPTGMLGGGGAPPKQGWMEATKPLPHHGTARNWPAPSRTLKYVPAVPHSHAASGWGSSTTGTPSR